MFIILYVSLLFFFRSSFRKKAKNYTFSLSPNIIFLITFLTPRFLLSHTKEYKKEILLKGQRNYLHDGKNEWKKWRRKAVNRELDEKFSFVVL